MNSDTTSKENEFPREITLKAVYRKRDEIQYEIADIFAKENLEFTISEKMSKGSKFSSFTLSAVYQSEELLNKITGELASIKGYMMMV